MQVSEEVLLLVGFLTGGLLVGAIGSWLDVLTAYIRKG